MRVVGMVEREHGFPGTHGILTQVRGAAAGRRVNDKEHISELNNHLVSGGCLLLRRPSISSRERAEDEQPTFVERLPVR